MNDPLQKNALKEKMGNWLAERHISKNTSQTQPTRDNPPTKLNDAPLIDERFSITDKGVFYQHNKERLCLCSKLEVIALAVDQSSGNWGRLLVITDADNNLHQ